MARASALIWTEPALADLDEIAAYIALDDRVAAAGLVRRVIAHVERLRRFPRSGRKVPELPRSPYREVVVPPCRVVYRLTRGGVYVVYVFRGERLLRRDRLAR